MKKIIALFLAALFVLPLAVANADIDLTVMTKKELQELRSQIDAEISANHSTTSKEEQAILKLTKDFVEEYLSGLNASSISWPWINYSYSKDWNTFTVETSVSYRTSTGKIEPNVYSELYSENGSYTLYYVQLGDSILLDNRADVPSAMPVRTASSASEEVEADNAAANVSAGPNSANDVSLSFGSATDEELDEAIKAIRAEQRARLKTKIALSEESVSIAKGKSVKLTAQVVDIPEDQKATKIVWSTSDNSIATVQNGTIAGKANGQAIITATSSLTDGTEISSECVVTVYTPVASLQASKKQFDIGVGESVTAEVTMQPRDASNTALKWESSDSSVASVNSDGIITGVGMGTATITATTTDGSEKRVTFTVKASKKDDRGKTLTNSDGVSLTVLSVKVTKGSGYAKAESGNTFVLVELQIENNSSHEISVNGIFGFDAYCDDYSVDYSFSASMNTKNEISSTDLQPGRKLKGWKGFEVPQDWKELVVKFTPDASIWGSGEKIEFVIYNN